MKTALLLATALSVSAVAAEAASLLTNGDFEAGNVGFSTDLNYVPGTGNGAGQYDVDTNPDDWFGSFADFGDNTSGTGNMMMVNGSTTAGDVVWSQTVNVSSDTDYSFAGFISAIFRGSSALTLEINSVLVGSITGPSTVAIWEDFDFTWGSGSATSATISLLQASTAFGGNDYALDDLSFTANGTTPPPTVPLPAAAWMLIAAMGGLFGLSRRKKIT
ncbi:MAG: VPLPA-CTERM sorting domain-containing protein [Pseudomonadota bacterium]